MIREEKKIPADAKDHLTDIVTKISGDNSVSALYVYGSFASGTLKPLSDLDFGILLGKDLDKGERFQKHLELFGTFNETFKTDEIDLIVMNDVAWYIGYNIIKTGTLLLCNNKIDLINFRGELTKKTLDFNHFRNAFDEVFLQGIGCNG